MTGQVLSIQYQQIVKSTALPQFSEFYKRYS